MASKKRGATATGHDDEKVMQAYSVPALGHREKGFMFADKLASLIDASAAVSPALNSQQIVLLDHESRLRSDDHEAKAQVI